MQEAGMYYNLIKLIIDHNTRICLIRVKFDKKGY